jgi:hypothetical protein
MSGRVDSFADLNTRLPSFGVKPRQEKPLAKETVDRVAEESGFPSRPAMPARTEKKQKRAPRRHRTGRNRHFGLKATEETIERFYKMADERKVVHGLLLEMALDALERAGDGSSS